MDIYERWEFVYEQINGWCMPGTYDGVRAEMVEGGVLQPMLERAYEARDRLCERMGIDRFEDPDLDEMMSAYEALNRACGKLMYQYGWQDGCAGRIALPDSHSPMRSSDAPPACPADQPPSPHP